MVTTPAEWVVAYEAIGGSVAVLRIGGLLHLASTQPRKTAGYELDEALTANPERLYAVCAWLDAERGSVDTEGQPPFRASAWLRAYRAAGGKAYAYAYDGDATDPADPFPVLSLMYEPRGPGAALAEALTADQRDTVAEHIGETEGTFRAIGRRG